ncbi:hypothetical protein Y1Q_0001549 [Alligator mississippiensis]|uniref:Uncharacterized protein n=1 Tax=Alligator mississippiensis TaxID=8496 RepID=A0A151M9Z4_ALLMI|nr:hypothetical protein Y1Q_0001549 [Alligator mississippiensis]
MEILWQTQSSAPESHMLFSVSGEPKEQPFILSTLALIEDLAVPRRVKAKEARKQTENPGYSPLKPLPRVLCIYQGKT